MLVLFALFLYTSMALVVEKNSLDVKSSDGILNTMNVYSGWLANGFNNLKHIVDKGLDMDWESTNGTFFDKEEEK